MADSTLSSTAGVNVLSLHQPSEYFHKGARKDKVFGGSGAQSGPVDFFSPSAISSKTSDLSVLQDRASNSLVALQKAEKGIAQLRGLVQEAETVARNAEALQAESATTSSTVTGLSGHETLEQAYGLDEGDSITIGDGVNSVTVTADGETTVNDLVSTVNANETVNVKASVYVGALKLEAGGYNEITASVEDNGGGANSISDIGFTDQGGGVIAEPGKISLNRLGYSNDFNEILNQIDEVVRDSSFNGSNLLKGSSIVEKFNTDNIPTIAIKGVDVDREGLGLNQAFSKFQTDADIRQSISELDAAAVELEGHAAVFAANRTAIEVNQGYSDGLITALQTGGTLDVSTPDESVVGLLAQQTRQLIESESDPLVPKESQDVLKSIG